MQHLRKWTFLLLFLAPNWSCDKDDQMTTKDKLIGDWEHSLTVRGSVHLMSGLPPSEYHFKVNNTFIQELGTFDWRDEGTWAYEESTGILSLNYKTYTYQESDTKSLDLRIE